VRRALANTLALVGAFALVLAIVELVNGRPARAGTWVALGALLVTATSWWGAVRLNQSPRSQSAASGHLVLFETPMPGVSLGQTPALTIRGARDAVERFIPFQEFESLFGGWALWAPPVRPTPELPGEALGVWSRRTCSRFRRILRERGAVVEVRREPGPEQQLRQLVARPGARV
jgi:hypothetical protein